jgi:hypothetical protein
VKLPKTQTKKITFLDRRKELKNVFWNLSQTWKDTLLREKKE